MTKTIAIACLLVFLAGCAGPEVRFHTLMPPPGQSLEQPAEVAQLQLEQVLVPAFVDRSELVVRQGDTALVVLSSDWWGATLAEEIRSALMARLAGAGATGETVRAAVRVTRFDAVAGQSASLSARYQLMSQAGDRSLVCTTTLQAQAGDSVESMVAAQQANVAALADEILAAAGPAWRCP